MRLAYDVGLDLGATLTKVVLVRSQAPLSEFESALGPVGDKAVLEHLFAEHHVRTLAAVGGGARALADSLAGRHAVTLVDEFEAWGAGARILLETADYPVTAPHLVVSLGTGTSILRLDAQGAAVRVGGTALGGGTLRGLGMLLSGEAGHDALAELARQGDSRRVDLLVRDLYRPGDIALMQDLTAANFGKVASRAPADLAAAAARLVGENVALLAGTLAGRIAPPPGVTGHRTDVVYAGSTLRGHDFLRQVLTEVTALVGARARFLPRGEFAGALGALARVRG